MLSKSTHIHTIKFSVSNSVSKKFFPCLFFSSLIDICLAARLN